MFATPHSQTGNYPCLISLLVVTGCTYKSQLACVPMRSVWYASQTTITIVLVESYSYRSSFIARAQAKPMYAGRVGRASVISSQTLPCPVKFLQYPHPRYTATTLLAKNFAILQPWTKGHTSKQSVNDEGTIRGDIKRSLKLSKCISYSLLTSKARQGPTSK